MYARTIVLWLMVICNANVDVCSAGKKEENEYCKVNDETYSPMNKSKSRWQGTKLYELVGASECYSGNERIPDANDKGQSERRASIRNNILPPILRPRVINGENADRERYNYMVSLTNIDGQHLCGGTLIAPDVILTAAHCFGVVKKAQIGRYDTSDFSETYENINIREELQHPNYDASLARNDFMLILLESPSSYPVIKLNEDDENIPNNLWVMGWGNQAANSFPYRGPLKEIELTYKSNERCRQSSGFIDGTFVSYFGLITDSMICAGDNSGGTCFGDSGGPLIIKGTDDQTDVQVGITSWSFSCGRPQFPGVFARVSKEIEWIKKSACVLSDIDPPSLGCTGRRPSRPDHPLDCRNDSDCRRTYVCLRGKCVPPRDKIPTRPDRKR